MNLLSKDIQNPPPEIVTLDVHNILDVGNAEPILPEENNIEFAIALANLVKPDDAPKQNDNIENNSESANVPVESEAVLARTDNFRASSITTEQHVGNSQNWPQNWPQDWQTEIKLDDRAPPEVQWLANPAQNNYAKLGQTVVQEKENLVVSASNIPVQTRNSDSIKNIPLAFDDPQILTSNIAMTNRLASNIEDTVFIDIGDIQKKIPSNKNDSSSVVFLLPTRDLTGANNRFPKTIPHDLLVAPLGETNSLQQMQIPIQMPIQVSSHISTQANSVAMQIREPMIEHLGTIYEASQDRSSHKPKDITVQLSPAELGRVQIRFSFEAGERVAAQLVAENSETVAILRQKSGLLLAQLKLGGFENIDLSFDTAGQRGFSGQNSGTDFFKNNNDQSEPDFWRMEKSDPKGDQQQLGKDDTNYQARSHMRTQSSQIDIIL